MSVKFKNTDPIHRNVPVSIVHSSRNQYGRLTRLICFPPTEAKWIEAKVFQIDFRCFGVHLFVCLVGLFFLLSIALMFI